MLSIKAMAETVSSMVTLRSVAVAAVTGLRVPQTQRQEALEEAGVEVQVAVKPVVPQLPDRAITVEPATAPTEPVVVDGVVLDSQCVRRDQGEQRLLVAPQ